MKILGVVGGLGPMATAYFYELVTNMTDAQTDQQHLDMMIHSIPSTPDRTAFLLGKSKESPVPPVLDSCKKLQAMGAQLIAVPCVTMSCFISELRKEINIPLIDMVEETAVYLKSEGIKAAGIMATDGTLGFGRFQKALEKEGIVPVTPDDDAQKLIMHIIYQNVKAGRPVESELFEKAAASLFEKGAECVILGCTELSVVKRCGLAGKCAVDAMEILAKRSVELCGAPLRSEYKNLIS